MGFIDDNLMQEEKVIHRTKIHWLIFSWPVIVGLLAVYAMTVTPENSITYFLVIVALFLIIRALVIYSTSEFGITDKRVLIKTGFIERNSHEVLLTKVEAIQVNQGIAGRMFDFGTIVIKGTGGSNDPFNNIVGPLTFRKIAQEQISKAQ